MSQSDLSETIQLLNGRLEELAGRLDKPRKNDKAALKETIRSLSAELGRLAESLDGAPAPPDAPAAPPRHDEFLAILGHELRNSLAPILNSLHVLYLRGGADEGARRFLEVIDRQTRQMAHLVDNLLDVTRIARGRVELHKEPAHLADVLGAAVDRCRPVIESRNQKLTVELPPRTVVVQADRSRLEQVFVNLIQNAAKFTDLGGHIWLTAETRPEEVTVRVADSGAGMTPETIGQLFEPFGPMEGTAARSRGGLGLGLALVHGLVRMHGGQIEAFSEGPGKGSEFLVRLPATLEAEPEPLPPEMPQDHEHPLRVLVVEDNKDTASTLGVILKLWGHEIEITYNGHAGLNAARQFHPDVVLLDIELPGLDGYDVAKALRQIPELDQTTIVAITGFGQPEDQQREREAGINHHYTKPIDLPSLRKLLALEKRATV